MVRSDAFKRCLTNLVSNAQRFGSDIVITGISEERYLTVHVDDDGPGVPEASREDVFKPFLRLDEARNQDHGGTGLGLAIARDIARSHGGDVALDQEPSRRACGRASASRSTLRGSLLVEITFARAAAQQCISDALDL